MVSKWWMRFIGGKPPSIENLHRIKSFGFFANFRRFKLDANTCDLSTAVSQEPLREQPQRLRGPSQASARYRNRTKKRRPGSRDVFSASHGILARAGGRAAAERGDALIGQAPASGGVGSRVGRVSGGVGHDPVLQAPAGGMRSRRPGR